MIQTAVYDPIVVDLTLNPEKIAELLTRGYESPKLDYKSEVDYAAASSRLKLVKHVLAMANTVGGFIVVGVTDHGARIGLDSSQARQLDEATVRGWVFGFTAVPIALAVHNSVTHEGQLYVIVAVLPLVERIGIASADAQYAEGNKNLFAFRKGDVLVRHGTASERWTQDDADYLIGRTRLSQKEAWLTEFANDFAKVQALLGTTVTATPSVDASAFQKTPEEFQQLMLDLLRAG